MWDDQYVVPVAEALLAHGTIKSAVVHSNDGLDELSISAPTRVVYVCNGELKEEVVDPSQIGLRFWNIDEVTAGDLDSATDMIYECLVEKKHGAPRDMVLLSSGMGLFLADKVDSVSAGIIMSAQSIDSGQTGHLIERWGEISHSK